MTQELDIPTLTERIAHKWAGLRPAMEEAESSRGRAFCRGVSGPPRVRRLTPADLDRALIDEIGTHLSGYEEDTFAAIYDDEGRALIKLRVGSFSRDESNSGSSGEPLGAAISRFKQAGHRTLLPPAGSCTSSGIELPPPDYSCHIVIDEAHTGSSVTKDGPWRGITIYPLDESAVSLWQAWAAAQDALGDRMAETPAEPEEEELRRQLLQKVLCASSEDLRSIIRPEEAGWPEGFAASLSTLACKPGAEGRTEVPE